MDLSYRDAFRDHAHVPSILGASLGTDVDRPLVTIAIPTYRRPQYLARVVQSAIEQEFADPVEIVIVDNDQDEERSQALLASLPAHPTRPIRYYTNAENIGMFGNWNRCIQLARGAWVTILNDDDILLPNFLRRSFRAIDKRPEIDGIVCRKLHYTWDTGEIFQSRFRRLVKSLIFRWRFDFDNLMRQTPRNLFFGNELENGCGFLFRRQVAIDLGGYREEEFPAADFWFYIRMCLSHNLFWLNEELAYIGWGANETANKSTIMKSIGLADDYYRTMTSRFVPNDWNLLRPQLTANQIYSYQKDLDVVFSDDELATIERAIGAPLPPPSYARIRRFRLLHGGY